MTALLAAGALILVWGLVRYGGPDGLWHRARAEIAPLLPRPVYVPTPLPVVTTLAPATPTTAPAPTATPRPSTAAPAVQPPLAPSVTASRTPTSAPIATPSYTPTPTATAVPLPTSTQYAIPSTVRLTGLAHAWQTWNNCGPATLAMHLSYFGLRIDQGTAGAALRPFKDDKNVNPEELAAFARSQDLAAMARVNGDEERLRQLLAAGLPVLIETWYEPKPNDGMGHYRLLVGYDDATGEWIAYDSYDSRGLVKGQPYEGIRLPYAEVTALWAVFNRAYIVLYDDARAAATEAILGPDLDDAGMWQRSLARARAEIAANEQDPFAWFNLGSSLVALGDYGPAADAFDRARRIGLPWRMLWYQFAPFRAYYETGRHQEVIALTDATLRTAGPVIEELFYWKGLSQDATGDRQSARASWLRALELNPKYAEARSALEAAQE